MIKRHGNKQIDYNHYFEISKSNKKENYEIDIWFFIPSSLNIVNYNKNEFFTDFNSYTRYNAPNISLADLIDFYNPVNPITRLENIIHIYENFEIIEYELKTLLNTFKISLENVVHSLIAMKNFSQFEVERNLVIQIQRFNLVLDKIMILEARCPKELQNVYNLVLEGLSLRIEKCLYRIYKISADLEEISVNEIKHQREFRESRGYSSITSTDENSNSRSIYREHIIKKWSESIMYINTENSKAQNGLNHIFLGTAAGLAMFITGVLTLLLARYLGNESIYLFIAALFLYSLKDRIKDIFKGIFVKQMNTIFSDRAMSIVSPINKKKCGRSTESVTFPLFKDLRKKIQSLRFNLNDDISIKSGQEDIIHYKKKVKISSKILYKNHSRLFGIKEIIRFDFRRWFHKMDKEVEGSYIPKGNKLIQVKGDRVYHFNAIMQIKSSKETTLKRYRIVANSHKIIKIYTIP